MPDRPRGGALLAVLALGALAFALHQAAVLGRIADSVAGSSDAANDLRRAVESLGSPQTVIQHESSMVQFKKSWRSEECGEVTVCTTCGVDYNGQPIPGETVQQCLQRHRATVALLEEACPPAG